MSREDIGVVVRATEAVYRRPTPDFETINELVWPDHVFVSAWTTAFGEPEATGAVGFKSWLQETESSMPWTGRIDGAVDLGAGVVLLVATLEVAGATSGVGGEMRIWCVYIVREGKIARTESHTHPREAIEAAVTAIGR